MAEFLVEEPYYATMELRENKLFGRKENLLGLGINKLLGVWSRPRLTEEQMIVDLLLLDEQKTLRPSSMSVDLNYITDIKFNAKKLKLQISYSFPKIESGWFGRGANKGKLTFQTVKFTEWQNHLTKIIMARKKEKLEPEVAKLKQQLEEITSKIERARQQLLDGKIDQDNFNIVTKDWMKKHKALSKKLKKLEKDFQSMR